LNDFINNKTVDESSVEINATNKCASLLTMLHTPLRKELSNDQKFIKEFGEKIGANFNNPVRI